MLLYINMDGYYSDLAGQYLVIDMISICKSKQPLGVSVEKLLFNLHRDCWGYSNGQRRISIIPMNTLATKNPSNHYYRVLNADLQYPIIINNNYDVMDGVHRLCKAYLYGETTINCYILKDHELDTIRK